MPSCKLDHLVVTAPNLEVGAKNISDQFGVPLQPGGEHPRMGTHNMLLKLGDSTYLEVIAVNPTAQKPDRPRWFELDRLKPGTPPKLKAWVVRTTDIQASLVSCTEPLGSIESMSRGGLNWLITIPSDGSLPLHGIAPALIEWQTEVHPAAQLTDVGCSLIKLEAYHPDPPEIVALLKSIDFQGNVTVMPLPAGERPLLVAHIQTPSGLKQLNTFFSGRISKI